MKEITITKEFSCVNQEVKVTIHIEYTFEREQKATQFDPYFPAEVTIKFFSPSYDLKEPLSEEDFDDLQLRIKRFVHSDDVEKEIINQNQR